MQAVIAKIIAKKLERAKERAEKGLSVGYQEGTRRLPFFAENMSLGLQAKWQYATHSNSCTTALVVNHSRREVLLPSLTSAGRDDDHGARRDKSRVDDELVRLLHFLISSFRSSILIVILLCPSYFKHSKNRRDFT